MIQKTIAIIGSREGFTKEIIWARLSAYLEKYAPYNIVTGGAPGVDTFAIYYAKHNRIPLEIIRPVDTTKKINYLFRNIEIITKADIVVAFWDGKSTGTKFVIDYTKARNKKIILFGNEN